MFKTIPSYLVFLCLFDHIYHRLISPEIDTKLELRYEMCIRYQSLRKAGRERRKEASVSLHAGPTRVSANLV